MNNTHNLILVLHVVMLSRIALAEGPIGGVGEATVPVAGLNGKESSTGGLSKSTAVFSGAEKAGEDKAVDPKVEAKTKKLESLPPAQEADARKEIEASADREGNIPEKELDRILNKHALVAAQEKLSQMSSASGSSNSQGSSGSVGKSASGGSHGSLSGSGGFSSGNKLEAYQPRSSPLQKEVNNYSASLASYSATASALLSDSSLARIQSSFIDTAREAIDMPRGKETALSKNFLFQSLKDDTKNSLKESFLGLVKNSASDKAPSSDLPYLKEIVSDTNFQFTAEKILGAENLSYLNLATISADMLNIKGLTGATYSTFLSLTEDAIPGAKASANVVDWMQAADFLSSKTFLANTRDTEFISLMRKGYSELTDTYKRLGALKSLDYLDLLQKPMKVDMKKLLDAGAISTIAALRQAKRLKPRADWDPSILSNFNFFQENINETLNAVEKVSSSEQLLTILDKFLSSNSLRAYWRSFDYPGYFKYRRGVAGVYFSMKFKGFNDFKVAPQIASNLAYGKTPQAYPKDKALFYVVSLAMDYVKNQRDHTKGLAELEQAKDEEYAITQLANDNYYINLEDEKN